jgi:ATP-dependent helicase/nuclease subunit B
MDAHSRKRGFTRSFRLKGLATVLAIVALQLGLLGLIARDGGFDGARGEPEAFEYWSLVREKDRFGKCVHADKDMGPEEFLTHAYRNFAEAAEKWLTGTEPFTAKLNPAYAPYGDYDQLMRLEEWYGRK